MVRDLFHYSKKGETMKALVLSSGGVDSSTALGLAVQKYGKENVITADAIILDKCVFWFNLVRPAIEAELGGYDYVVIGPDR